MNGGGPGLDLGRPREVAQLLRDALEVYGRNFATLLAVAAAVVAPVQLIVSGIGLEELAAPYREQARAADTLVPSLVSFLVVAPLITAATIHALRRVGAGERPRAGETLQEAMEAFQPVFAAVLLAALGIALGLLALIVPGIYLAVRWFFVPQAVVIEGRRGSAALQRSGELVQGSWWRCFGVVLLSNLAAVVPGVLVLTPLQAAAKAADRQALVLGGNIVVEALTAPFVALVATLLYHDLLARRQRPGAGP